MGSNRDMGDSGTIYHQALLITTLQCHPFSALLQASLGWNSGIPLPGRPGKSHTPDGWSKLPPKVDESSTRGVLSWNSALSLTLLLKYLPATPNAGDRQIEPPVGTRSKALALYYLGSQQVAWDPGVLSGMSLPSAGPRQDRQPHQMGKHVLVH